VAQLSRLCYSTCLSSCRRRYGARNAGIRLCGHLQGTCTLYNCAGHQQCYIQAMRKIKKCLMFVQVINSAKANAENNHGMDASKLAVGEHHPQAAIQRCYDGCDAGISCCCSSVACNPQAGKGSQRVLFINMNIILDGASYFCGADTINVGGGQHLKKLWIHGRGKSSVRRLYRTNMEVRYPALSIAPPAYSSLLKLPRGTGHFFDD